MSSNPTPLRPSKSNSSLDLYNPSIAESNGSSISYNKVKKLIFRKRSQSLTVLDPTKNNKPIPRNRSISSILTMYTSNQTSWSHSSTRSNTRDSSISSLEDLHISPLQEIKELKNEIKIIKPSENIEMYDEIADDILDKITSNNVEWNI